MAAFDLFRTVTAGLTEADRTSYGDLIHQAQSDLLAARSEEARVRLVHEFITELHGLRGHGIRPPIRAKMP